MKYKELRMMNETELENRMVELEKELMRINSQIATGTVPKNPSKARVAKKTIAKILTIKQQRGGTKKE